MEREPKSLRGSGEDPMKVHCKRSDDKEKLSKY
jgi:hypothetical protein